MNRTRCVIVFLFMSLPVIFFSMVYVDNSYSAGNSYSSDYGSYKPVAAVKVTKTAQVKKITKEESIENLRLASEKANEAADKLLLALDKFKTFAKTENIAAVLPADSTQTASAPAMAVIEKNDKTDAAVIVPQ